MSIMKVLEIRDKGTFIPALALRLEAETEAQAYLLRKVWFVEGAGIVLMQLNNQKATSDPYDWGDRTMLTAHLAIEKHWDMILDGDVVDVEFIVGETAFPKPPQRITQRETTP